MAKFHSDKPHDSLCFLIFLVIFFSYQLLSLAYTLPDQYFINCGSNIDITVSSQTTFVGDLNSDSVSFTKGSSFVTDNSQTSETPSLYQTARVFRHKSSYEFKINTNGTYLVRLHFSNSADVSAAVFNVSAFGLLLLHNFSVQDLGGGSTLTKEFIFSIPIGKLLIYFVPQGSSFAFVNAIEVFPAPPDFILDDAMQYLNDPNTAKNSPVFAGVPNYLDPVSPFIAPDQNVSSFFLYINSNFGLEINPYEEKQELGTPFFKDFVLYSGDSGFINISIGPDSSSLQKNAFLNGVEIMEMIGKSDLVPVTDKSNQLSPFVVVGSVLGGQVLVCIFGGLLLATKNFDKKLKIGKGGFGNVYRGTLRNDMKVAVKRSEPVRSRLEMILVYELMEKGTLRDHLYNTKLPCLSWKQRLDICIGAARGLHYLHKGASGGIIHRDVKSTNILLDNNLVAKVADFGLSRSGRPDQTHVSTDIKGTLGYLDPEYFKTQQLTGKSDVYSFGVVLLEVLCARPAIDPKLPREEVNLADWGMCCKNKGFLDQIVDPSIRSQTNPNSLRKFAEIAEKCLQEDASDRPTMCDMAWDLEYALKLQQTTVVRDPHEDSTSEASVMLSSHVLERLPSTTPEFGRDDMSMSIERENDSDSVPTECEVFSQLRIDDAR
ncbi:putative receptor-like protein kinase [Hibiscus syriacus]|uniref:Receptor-like protein kinase n=1 Tax=Hibiscus syriacus TaxID=106335 RepID=A0A6A3C459_HIBSY|nr:putative receptor-like protein kinase [Hibiscus syriacus]